MIKEIFCPACKSKLVIGGKEHLQSLLEHVFTPNEQPTLKEFYVCKNPQCECSIYNIKWTEYGEIFAGKKYKEFENIEFIDNNNAPFGTPQRKINVEVYKKDEDFYIPLLFGYKIKIQYDYDSDFNGNILSKKINPFLIRYDVYVNFSWKKLLKVFGIK